jgi:hypothetical protein
MKKRTETAHTTFDTRSKCAYCGKLGYVEEKCFKKQKDTSKEDKEKLKETAEVIIIASSNDEKQCVLSCTSSNFQMNINTFIADSGATSHMRYSKIGMSNLQDWKAEVTVGNSGVMWSAAKGTYKGTIIQQDSTNLDKTLNDV